MSSVLIAIIGMALFVGIAIGGAVFLGPQFERSQDSAVAARVLGDLGEVASGTDAARLALGVNGGSTIATPAAVSTAGFLRQVPADPTGVGRTYALLDEQGYQFANSPSQATWSPRYAMLSLASDKDLCTTVGRKAGMLASGTVVSDSAASPTGASGCIRFGGSAPDVANGDYVAYVRL